MIRYIDLLWILPLNVILGFITCFLFSYVSIYFDNNDDDDFKK